MASTSRVLSKRLFCWWLAFTVPILPKHGSLGALACAVCDHPVSMQVSDAIQFCVSLQRALTLLSWEQFETHVPIALWRAPKMPPAPCVRTAIDHSHVETVVRSPATGRVVVAGPHTARVIAMAHAAAPGECMLTQAAMDSWRAETLVCIWMHMNCSFLPSVTRISVYVQSNSLDGGNPFQHLLPRKINQRSSSFQQVSALLSAVYHGSANTSNTSLSRSHTGNSSYGLYGEDDIPQHTEQDAGRQGPYDFGVLNVRLDDTMLARGGLTQGCAPGSSRTNTISQVEVWMDDVSETRVGGLGSECIQGSIVGDDAHDSEAPVREAELAAAGPTLQVSAVVSTEQDTKMGAMRFTHVRRPPAGKDDGPLSSLIHRLSSEQERRARRLLRKGSSKTRGV